MRKFLFNSIVLVGLLTGPAMAADLPVKAPIYETPVVAPVYNWTGFYVGGNAGYGWGKVDNNVNLLDTFGGLTGTYSLTTSGKLGGWLGGIQAGYNWQRGSMVLGVEADIDFGNIKADSFVAPLMSGGPVAGSYYQAHEEIKWFGTARGRIGFTPTDQWLVYATGGLAFGRVDYSALTSFPLVQYAGSESATKSGWTLGAGTELAVGNNWSAKVEYLYYDLGSKRVNATSLRAPQYIFHTDFTTSGNLVRVGLNKKLW